MVTKDLQKKITAEVIPELQQDVFELNDYMAAHPELGSQEYEASARIVKLLEKHGLTVEYPFGGLQTAFKASINPGKEKKAVLLAEYDALPEIGHGCGHCASGMATVLAGLALSAVKEELDFQIDILGTPDEEMTGSKCVMADDHVFDEYDFAAMAHMGGENVVEISFLALDALNIQFTGRPAHAAAQPELGRNALNAARLFFDSTDMMRQHVVQEARMHGYMKKGGAASNVVPDYAEVEFLTRAPKRTDLSDITAWVKECAQAAAMATRTEVKMEPLGSPFHELYISPEGRQLLEDCFREADLELSQKEDPAVGSSDIGNVDYVCPAFHPMVSIGQPLDVHTREFAEAMTDPKTHQAIVNAAQLLLNLVFKLYTEEGRLERIKEVHKAYRGY